MQKPASRMETRSFGNALDVFCIPLPSPPPAQLFVLSFLPSCLTSFLVCQYDIITSVLSAAAALYMRWFFFLVLSCFFFLLPSSSFFFRLPSSSLFFLPFFFPSFFFFCLPSLPFPFLFYTFLSFPFLPCGTRLQEAPGDAPAGRAFRTRM